MTALNRQDILITMSEASLNTVADVLEEMVNETCNNNPPTIAGNIARLEEALFPLLMKNCEHSSSKTSCSSSSQESNEQEGQEPCEHIGSNSNLVPVDSNDFEVDEESEDSQAKEYSQDLLDQIEESVDQDPNPNFAEMDNHPYYAVSEWDVIVPDTVTLQNGYTDEQYSADFIIQNRTCSSAIFKIEAESSKYHVYPNVGYLPNVGGTNIKIEVKLCSFGKKEIVDDSLTVYVANGITPTLTSEEYDAFWETLREKHPERIREYKIRNIILAEEEYIDSTAINNMKLQKKILNNRSPITSPKCLKAENEQTEELDDFPMRQFYSKSTTILQQNVNSIRSGLSESVTWACFTIYLACALILGAIAVQSVDNIYSSMKYTDALFDIFKPEEPKGWFSWFTAPF